MKLLDKIKSTLTKGITYITEKLWEGTKSAVGFGLREIRDGMKGAAPSRGQPKTTNDVTGDVAKATDALQKASGNNKQLEQKFLAKSKEYKDKHPKLAAQYAKQAERLNQQRRSLHQVQSRLQKKSSGASAAPKQRTKTSRQTVKNAQWTQEMEQRIKNLSKSSSSTSTASSGSQSPSINKSKTTGSAKSSVRRTQRNPNLSDMTKKIVKNLPSIERQAEKMESDAAKKLEQHIAKVEKQSQALDERMDYMSNAMAGVASGHVDNLDAKAEELLKQVQDEIDLELQGKLPSVPTHNPNK